MLTLTATQQAIIDSPIKSVTWLFQVTDAHLVPYFWSTKYVPPSGAGVVWETGVEWETGVAWTDGADGSGYAFKVTDFNGLTLSRPRTETGIMPPSELSFSVVNKDSTLSPDDFEGGYVKLALLMGDTVAEETPIAVWKFLIKRVSGGYQTLDFVCEDFFQQFLQGVYPGIQYKMTGDAVAWEAGVGWEAGVTWTDGTSSSGQVFSAKVHDIFPTTNGVGDLSDWVCCPQPFGVCYVPLRFAVIIGNDGYYVLGPTRANGAALTYTINKVRSPRDYSTKAEYAMTFTQATAASAETGDFRVFTAALAAAPVNGLFMLGDHYYDLPTQFSRSDTVAVTNPADVIEYMLLDIGVDPRDINDASFTTAAATFTGWGLAYAGAFWKVTSREEALSSLLVQCHATLLIGEQISLHVLDSTSQQTIISADIVRPKETGVGSFRHTALERTLADCGTVRYSPTDDAQDVAAAALVPAKITKRHTDETALELPFIADATIAKELARLYYQRKLLKKSEQRFTAKATALAIEPGDFLTLTGANYGGSHAMIVDAMTIGRDAAIDFVCTEFSDTIENYT
jgi:hypothetical protein